MNLEPAAEPVGQEAPGPAPLVDPPPGPIGLPAAVRGDVRHNAYVDVRLSRDPPHPYAAPDAEAASFCELTAEQKFLHLQGPPNVKDAPSAAPTTPAAPIEETENEEEEFARAIRASLDDEMVKALPVFSPLMVIPGAAS